ncbi:MAG: hypothetical protein IH989_04075 [Planctomycetes bacterium]|nr:hypothetical protein [Planctomycetota bacterium]
MKANTEQSDRSWDSGWEEHKKRQLLRLASLPFEKKLEWLEEAQQLGERLISQARRRRGADQSK